MNMNKPQKGDAEVPRLRYASLGMTEVNFGAGRGGRTGIAVRGRP